MDDLISRKMAIDGFYEMSSDTDHLCTVGDYISFLESLSAQPEIIRCKDCKYWMHIKRTKRYWCKTADGLYDINPSPNDFCSRAERRTDEIDRR